MTEVYTICSDFGDEYKLQFTTERSGIIADDILNHLDNAGIAVVEIGLARVRGTHITNSKVLVQIENSIADFMQRHRNVVISYFCDFINLLPATRKSIPVQEYRSRLFSAMFKRYMSQQDKDVFCDDEIKINGVAETFYFHVIYRKEHQLYAEMIAEGHHKDFDKPED